MQYFTLIFYLFFYNLSISEAIIGYDCGHQNMTFARISLRSVTNCDIPVESVDVSPKHVHLLELNNNIDVQTYSCKIEIYRDVYHCGNYGHIGTMTAGKASYIYNLGAKRCRTLIEENEITLFSTTKKPLRLISVKPGVPITMTHTLAGWSDTSGYCGGDYYRDPFGSWDNVVVIGYIKVLVNNLVAQADIEKNVIHLSNGVVCTYKKGECVDDTIGETYWTLIPEDNCNSYKYSLLYKGWANYTTTNGQTSYIDSLITVATDQILFSLKLISYKMLCGAKLYQTEHPKLFIIMHQEDITFLSFRRKTALSLDLFTYINSKFVYVERLIQLNMKTLYHRIAKQQCELRKQTMILQLTIAKIDPDEFAYIYTETPGYSATKLGEVIYLIKCQPVPVSLRRTHLCYQELPVLYNNQSYFLTPKTRLLQKVGTQLSCNPILPAAYELEGSWFSIGISVSKIHAPETLNPVEQKVWDYESPTYLATSGIYSTDDLDTLREHIMYGAERQAIENVLVRGFINQNPDFQGGSMVHMFGEEEIEKFGEKMKTKVWSWMLKFGDITSVLMFIFMVIKLLIWIFNSLINCKVLYGIYGFSIKLCAAMSDALVMCITHNRLINQQNVSDDQEITNEQEIPLSDMTVTEDLKSVTTHHFATAPHNDKMYPHLTACHYDQ